VIARPRFSPQVWQCLLLPLLLILLIVLTAGCGGKYGAWPGSSRQAVATLDHPTIEESMRSLDLPAQEGYRFVAFGDQRALADGEWQAMMSEIGRQAGADQRLLFMLDTGDIVHDGRHADQFAMTADILAPARRLPYLVGVGNHELHNNKSTEAQENCARFLGYLDPQFATGRMWYRKDIGPVTYLFLDTNDLVYGVDGKQKAATEPRPGSAQAEQFVWLTKELDLSGPAPAFLLRPTVVAVLHHPFIQTSAKHRGQSQSLWDLSWEGRRLVDLLLDGGVDLVLTGHTHTYERFRITRRADSRSLAVINVSGRPRHGSFLAGAGARRAVDIRGQEQSWLSTQGWQGLEAYEIVQEEAMVGEQTNQFAHFAVNARGSVLMTLHRQDREQLDRFHADPPVRLK